MNLDKLKESARKYEQSGQWRPAIDVYKKALREFEESGTERRKGITSRPGNELTGKRRTG